MWESDNIVGFDLDGVLVSNLKKPESWTEKQFLEAKSLLKPIFQPDFPFVIITGRPTQDKPLTLSWIESNFEIKPVEVYHDNDNFDQPWIYKLQVLRENKRIGTFIDDNTETVLKLKPLLRDRLILTTNQFLLWGLEKWGKSFSLGSFTNRFA